MTMKLRLWIGALALSTVAMAGPKTYNVTLSNPMTAGSTQLPSGEYRLKVEGTNAIFTSSHTHESVTVPVKVENSETKYNLTSLGTTQQGDTTQITSIRLGGTHTKLEFGQ